MKIRFLIITVFALISLNVPDSFALECEYPLDYPKLVEEYDYVLIAEVMDIDPAENENSEIVIFNLYEHVKGEIPGYLFEIEQEKNSPSGVNFEIGQAYNVFVNDGDPMYVGPCATLPLEDSENYENYPHDIIQCGPKTALIDGVCHAFKIESTRHQDCLIATASFGSELAPQVQMLREIRDNTLLTTYSGKTFMNGFNSAYYSFSPHIAQLENEHPIFKDAIRLFITPMIVTLSIMTLADEGSELHVILFGISTIGLLVGMYVVAPTVLVWQVRKRK